MRADRLTFVKHQIGDLTGLSDSTLNYWMREKVIRPIVGGEGKGSHRRFSVPDVNLAALLKEIARYGVNLQQLKALSDKFYASYDYVVKLGFNQPDDLRLVFLASQNYDACNRNGYVSFGMDAKPGAAPDFHSKMDGQPRVRLTWPETREYMLRPSNWYETELDAKFTAAHLDAAERLSFEEVSLEWGWLRRISRVYDEKPASPFPDFFVLDKDGGWHVFGSIKDAANMGHSAIAVDVGTLIHNVWNGIHE